MRPPCSQYRNISGTGTVVSAVSHSSPSPMERGRTSGLVPIVLAAKEGLALINGTQVSTALALAALFKAHRALQAALIIEMAAKLHGGKAPKKFTYRGLQPLFEGTEFSVNANETETGLELWTANAEGQPTMKGAAVW